MHTSAHIDTNTKKKYLSCTQQHTLSASFLVNESTVAGSDRISGMETLDQKPKL
jgi:hypothetical protein